MFLSQNVICGLKSRLKMSLSSSDDRSYCVAWVVEMIANRIQRTSLRSAIPAFRGGEMKNNTTIVQELFFWKDLSAYEVENCQVEVPVTVSRCLLKFYSTDFSRIYQTQKYPYRQERNIIVSTAAVTTLGWTGRKQVWSFTLSWQLHDRTAPMPLLGSSLRKNKVLHDHFVYLCFSQW